MENWDWNNFFSFLFFSPPALFLYFLSFFPSSLFIFFVLGLGCFYSFYSVDLKKIKEPAILPAKWVYSGIAENCNSGHPNHRQVQRVERGLLYSGKEEAGRSCYGLSLTERGSFSLAGLLLDQEKFFLSPARICKVSFILLGLGKCRVCFLPQGVCVRASPAGLLDLVFKEISFIFTADNVIFQFKYSPKKISFIVRQKKGLVSSCACET